MEVKRDTFIFYRSFRDALDDLPDDVRGRLYKAIADYALDQIEPSLPTGVDTAVWKLIEPQLNANMKRYLAVCKRHQLQSDSEHTPNTLQSDSEHTPNTLQSDSEHTPNTLQSDSEHTPNTLQSDSEHTPNTLQSDSEHTPNTLQSDSEHTPNKTLTNDKCIMNNEKGVMKNAKDKPSNQLFVANAPNSSSGNKFPDSEDEAQKPSNSSLEVQEPLGNTKGQQGSKEHSGGNIDLGAFARFFNEEMDRAGAVIPRVRKLTGQRVQYIRSRIREFSKEDLAIVVRKAAASDFLNGKSDRGFIADFTWIFRPNNFPKILEGNYDNETRNPDNSAGVLAQWTGGRSAASIGQGTKAEFNAEAIRRSQVAVARVVQGVDEPKPDF